MKKRNRYAISYAMSVKAAARISAAQMRECLSRVKTYKVLDGGSGTAVTWEEQDRRFRFNLDENRISIDMSSNAAMENPKKEMLLRMFELMSSCRWQYDIPLSEIYGHVAESLVKNQLNYYSNAMKEMNSNEYSDILLAKRIIELRRQNLELESNLARLRNKLYRAAPELIIARSGRESTIQEIMEYTGLDKQEVQSALKELPDLGYRVMPSGGNKLNVVKI